MKKVFVVTSTRADWGLLKPVCARLDREKDIQLTVVATGTHLKAEYGSTIEEIIEYKKEVEVKLEKQKKKLEQFSKYEKIKNEWLKKITQSEEIEKILMEQGSVIGATCIGIANYTTNFDLKFDLVIVDEAGRATPPEILVPMVLGKKIILVGDHKQLPPVIDKMLAHEIKVRENYNKRD